MECALVFEKELIKYPVPPLEWRGFWCIKNGARTGSLVSTNRAEVAVATEVVPSDTLKRRGLKNGITRPAAATYSGSRRISPLRAG